RPRQMALVNAIRPLPAQEAAFLYAAYPENGLLEFAVEVISRFGFDWTRGRQDKSAHPFATALSPNDVRITTRFVEHQPFELFFSTLHETGHALYEQGISPEWTRTPVSA